MQVKFFKMPISIMYIENKTMSCFQYTYVARSLGFSSFGESRFFGENRRNVRHNRRPDKNAFSSKVKVMIYGGNRRRSVSQAVIGFSDEHRAALRDQDESFYGDIISDDDSESSVSSSD